MNSNHRSVSSHLRRLSAALAAVAGIFGFQVLHAGNTWDGGGGANTTITNDLNWGGAVNALDGSQPATFATGGSNATLNVNARFKSLTFNRDDAAGFTINGPGTLTVSNTTSGSTVNFLVSDTVANGSVIVNAPVQVTTAPSGNRFLVIRNNEVGTTGPGLIFSNSISATVPANSWGLRLGGAGLTKFVGPINNCGNGIQPTFTISLSGTNIIAGNQAIGSAATVNMPGSTSAAISPTARLQMGETTADIQSWGSTTINQASTLAVNSSATLNGAVVICTATSSGSSGGTLEVNGSLSATTLGIGSSVYTGILRIGGNAAFSGAVTIGAAAGNTIVGNATTPGTLSLSSGTISGNVTIGGFGENEDNLILVKTNSGTLTLGGTHSYTNATLVKAGRLDLAGSIASSVSVSNGATLGGEGSTTGAITFGLGTETLAFDPSTVEALTANTIDARAATVVVSPSTAADGIVLQTTGTPILGSIGANFVLGSRSGTLSFNATSNELHFANGPAAAANLKWVGNAANPTFWDVLNTPNWLNGLTPDRFYGNDNVRFDDSASSFNVAVQGAVTAGNIVFSNSANAYTVSGGGMGGSGWLTKYGINLLTLTNSSANTFTGGLTNHAGRIVFNNLNQLGNFTNAPLALSGGSLSYAGSANGLNDLLQLDIQASGVDIGVLVTNVYFGRGKVTGPGNWSKSGPGWLLLGVNSDTSPGNDFTGKLTITSGLVDIRHADSLGSTAGITEVQGAILEVQHFSQTSFSTITIPEPLLFSGASYLMCLNQEAKTFTDIFSGPITNASGGTLAVSTAQTTASAAQTLELSGSIETGAGSALVLGRRSTHTTTLTNLAQTIIVSGAIAGAGAVQTESTTNASLFTLAGANTYTGSTTVSGGTLSLGYTGSISNSPVITVSSNAILDVSGVAFALGVGQTLKGNGSINGDVTADGTLSPDASVGTLTFNNNLIINGNLLFELNKSLVQSNDMIAVLGTLNNTGTGKLTVSNLGPGLVAGDKFTLFSQSLPNGQSLTLVPPPGVTFTNTLAEDGSITVLSAPPIVADYPTNIAFSFSGGALMLSWPATHQGWYAQSNSVSVSSSSNWHDVPGSQTGTNLTITINPALTNVFYRLRYP